MTVRLKTGIFWVVSGSVFLLLWQGVKLGNARPAKSITFTELINEVQSGKLSRVTITNGMEVTATYADSSPPVHALIPANYIQIYNLLQEHGVNVEIREAGRSWVSVVLNSAPFLVLLAFWVFLMRRMQNRGRPSGTSL